MLNHLFGFGSLMGLYSGSSLVGAVSYATCEFQGRIIPCHDSLSFLVPLMQVFGSLFIFFLLFMLAACIFLLISWWKLFEKAGRLGWTALIPIYNIVVTLEMVGMSPWLVLLVFIPVVGPAALFIVSILMNIKLAKAFGKEEIFAIGLILLPIVFIPILAFDKSKFNGIAPKNPNTPTAPTSTPAPAPQTDQEISTTTTTPTDSV